MQVRAFLEESKVSLRYLTEPDADTQRPYTVKEPRKLSVKNSKNRAHKRQSKELFICQNRIIEYMKYSSTNEAKKLMIMA